MAKNRPRGVRGQCVRVCVRARARLVFDLLWLREHNCRQFRFRASFTLSRVQLRRFALGGVDSPE